MIISALLLIIYYLVYALTYPLRYLSDVSANSSFTSAITTVNGYLAAWNDFLPITTIFQVFAAIIAIELVIAVYKVIMWIIRRFPTQS